VPKVCVAFLVWFSLDSDGSESSWWTISILQLVSRVHCPNLVLFILFLVFLQHPTSSIDRNRESGSLSVYFYIPAASNLSRTKLEVRRNLFNYKTATNYKPIDF
jgi:hypothetical protein